MRLLLLEDINLYKCYVKSLIVCQVCLHKCTVIGQELIPWSGVFPQKQTGPELVKFPSIGDKHVCSLPHSQVPVTSLYPEPDSSSPCLPIPPLGDPFCCYPPIYVKTF